MSKIIKLDKTLANQIAAGEVVERPVSVIKELCENSIDAKASFLKIEIENGGTKSIIVTDDGEGIEKEDLALCLEKYTSSKIKTIEDLYNIMTFGFRGEALSSISSVSKFSIVSKTQNNNFGYSISFENGEKSQVLETPSETGTKVIVKDLFYNTPARLNYLKKASTEYAHILDFLNKLALSHPNIALEFVSDSKRIFKYNKDEDLKTRIYNIYGEKLALNLLNINFEIPGFKISGYVSDPKISFPNRNRQALFVNKRIIKSPLISKAITNAYNRFIPHSSFPAYILNIDIDPTQIDVNVHPRKLEVRFAQESQIFRGIYHSIEKKLAGVSLIGDSDISKSQQSTDINFSKNEGQTTGYYTGSGTKFKSYSPYKDTSPNPAQTKISQSLDFSKEISKNFGENLTYGETLETSSDLSMTPLGKIIGQTFNSYIIVETKDGLKILDQHALAERVIYEKLVNQKSSHSTQGLLIGTSVNLEAKELAILKDNKEIFESMGFDFEIMSSGIVMINGIPDFIKKENIENIFIGILSDISEYGFSKSKTLQEVKNKIFAYTACRSAIKFGNKLNLFEMNKLLCDSVLDYSATCPHGRPVIFEIGLEGLKNKYER